LLVLVLVLAAAYAALWVVRLTRSFGQVPRRAFLRTPAGPLVFAHRGASGEVAEHTMAAYRRALAEGADVLELDLHRAEDGALVVSHDGDLGRALGARLEIAEHDLAALRAGVAAAHPGQDPAELVPTLDDVVAAFPTARFNLELKADSEALAADVAAAVERHGAIDRVLVASFHGGALAAFRRASHGRVATSASTGEVARFLLCYLLDVPSHPDYEALQVPIAVRRSWPSVRLDTPGFVAFAHRHGLAVHYWTVDQPAELAHLVAIGADGLISNFPDRAVAARAERRP
jgi:glycerophosphoryl diester phosphodiesterase